MKKIIKKILCTFLCTALILTTAGCNFNSADSENTDNANSNGCLELVNSPSTTLDNVWYNPGGIFRCAIFESLLLANADMTQFKGALAKDYDISDDGMVYTFTLRDQVTWHDGEALTMEDIIFSFQMALRCNDLNGLIASAFQFIEGAGQYASGTTEEISGITIDGQKMTICLTAPSNSFLNAIAQFAILPEHLLKDAAPEQLSNHEYWKKPIGSGCYMITHVTTNNSFTLEAYEDYYGAQPGIQKIHLQTQQKDSITSMRAGLLDFYITNDPEEIAELKGMSHCSDHPLNILFPAYLIVNLSDDAGTHPSLKDVRVREALLLAIDRKTIIDAIFPGSSVTDTLVPSWSDYYWEDGKEYNFDPERAKELLLEAGFDFSTPIRLRYSIKGQSTADLMNAIAVYWRAIGINVDLEMFEGSGSNHMFHIRDFDVCYKRLSAFHVASIYDEVYGEAVMQTNLLNQPVYDQLIDELEKTLDTETRQELIQEMQMLDQEYLLRIPLFALANVAFVNDEHLQMPDAYGNMWYRYDLQFEDWRLIDNHEK